MVPVAMLSPPVKAPVSRSNKTHGYIPLHPQPPDPMDRMGMIELMRHGMPGMVDDVFPPGEPMHVDDVVATDRKSTRLNSSHYS